MKQCKLCKEWKSESDFYNKSHYVNGKYYISQAGRCKKCEIACAKFRRENNLIQKRGTKNMYQSRDIDSFVISETLYNTPKKPVEEEIDPEAWVIRNLKTYGNCFVGRKHDFDRIEKEVGKLNYIVKENGYILEVAK